MLAAFAEGDAALVRGGLFAEVVVAAAEAQSAVRAAFYALRGEDAGAVTPNPRVEDGDQLGLFRWLREATDVNGIYVARHMRWQDPADPGDAGAVAQRVRALAGTAGIEVGSGGRSGADKLLKAVAYHVKRLASNEDGWDAAHERGRVLAKVDAAVRAGVSPSDRRLHNLLAPVADALARGGCAEVPEGAARAIASLRGGLGDDDDRDWEREGPSYGPQVAAAAALLRGSGCRSSGASASRSGRTRCARRWAWSRRSG